MDEKDLLAAFKALGKKIRDLEFDVMLKNSKIEKLEKELKELKEKNNE